MEPCFISWSFAAAHTFDFSFPDAWSRKKIEALPSRRPEVSAEMWNEVYTPTDDLSRLKWSGEVTVVMLEVAKESRGGSYITIEDLAPHGEESVEFLVNDELFLSRRRHDRTGSARLGHRHTTRPFRTQAET